MVLFNVNGERNSGTNFLHLILDKNNFPVYDQKAKRNGRIFYQWKHGVPTDDYKNLDVKVVDLFVFRNLEDWLISFYKNPYHVEKFKNFSDFLTLPQRTKKHKLYYSKTNKCINIDDNGKTIFQIREYKFKKIMEYKKRNNDVILINLSFIQNEKKLLQFLKFLSSKYLPNLKFDNYSLSIKHTKNSLNIKNRNYDIDISKYQEIINSRKNEEMEKFINNLTYN